MTVKSEYCLSKIARDPIVAAFLARGERDLGTEPVPSCLPKSPLLADGAAEKVQEMADA
ncbi:hypothetical protein [Mesorhizobium sp. ES1-3]|uniref:hypothetical protein n=1 Tax=Mesorhizobium sp. ES1-3 TaxID=2876628 RepID=UPI001CCA035F|nr:hypothetical protein [Mesorhizobium sp. ES1-3]MBZ9673430.1 hypothetical protein [Mesorhizobium sp. ES1-3]